MRHYLLALAAITVLAAGCSTSDAHTATHPEQASASSSPSASASAIASPSSSPSPSTDPSPTAESKPTTPTPAATKTRAATAMVTQAPPPAPKPTHADICWRSVDATLREFVYVDDPTYVAFWNHTQADGFNGIQIQTNTDEPSGAAGGFPFDTRIPWDATNPLSDQIQIQDDRFYSPTDFFARRPATASAYGHMFNDLYLGKWRPQLLRGLNALQCH